jgi:hypothetical protein
MKVLKQWTDRKLRKLKQFSEIEIRDGSVSIIGFANITGETTTAAHNFKNYCLNNNIIKEVVKSRYGITDFGKSILEENNE